MPEGDTIHRLADRVRSEVGGRTVTGSVFRHPRLATLDLTGRTLVDATSHGKHLFLSFDDGWSLHVHLLMDGRVRFGPRGRNESVEEWRRRFEIVFDGTRMTGVDIPVLHRIRTGDIPRVVGHLGPDLCGHLDADDLEVVLARLGAAPDAPLAGALLDQRNVAGFGNVYAIEVPFICGVSPFRPVGGIDALDQLLAVGAALIRTNARLGPQNTTGRRLERSDHWIITRDRACPRCGDALRRLAGAECPWGRGTAWCPTCQAATNDTVDAARARRLLGLHPARHLLAFDGPVDANGGPDTGGDGDRGPAVAFTGPPDPVEVRRAGRR
jgi:endonuclease VIII